MTGGNFGVWGGMFSTFDCAVKGWRQKEDAWNAIISGFMTGGCLAARSESLCLSHIPLIAHASLGGPKSALGSAIACGILLGVFEGVGVLLSRVFSEGTRPQLPPRASPFSFLAVPPNVAPQYQKLWRHNLQPPANRRYILYLALLPISMYNRHSMHGYFSQWQGTYIYLQTRELQRVMGVTLCGKQPVHFLPASLISDWLSLLVEISIAKSISKFASLVDAIKAAVSPRTTVGRRAHVECQRRHVNYSSDVFPAVKHNQHRASLHACQ